MEAKNLTDDWDSFKSAIIERFTDRMECRKDFQRMRDLEYQGNCYTPLVSCRCTLTPGALYTSTYQSVPKWGDVRYPDEESLTPPGPVSATSAR